IAKIRGVCYNEIKLCWVSVSARRLCGALGEGDPDQYSVMRHCPIFRTDLKPGTLWKVMPMKFDIAHSIAVRGDITEMTKYSNERRMRID
ncbi:MAG: hypothetical protein IJV52_04870, partial [Prevotella sp.]|nr:hypothetical protein [Prevotella sp.]